MQRLIKPYIYLLAVIAAVCLAHFAIKQSPYFNMTIVLFILLTIFLQYNEAEVDDNISMSLSEGSSIFMILCFGVYPSIIACSIGFILTAVIRYKHVYKTEEWKERDSRKIIKYKDVGIKILFNISKEIIYTSIIFFIYLALKINLRVQLDMWKVGLVFFAGNTLDILLVTLATSFNTGTWYKEALYNSKTAMYTINNMVMSIILTYTYINIGLAGTLLIYVIVFPLQKMASMYSKIKEQEKDLFIDELTQSYNLRFFKDLLGNKMTKDEPISLIMIDLDNFKCINDNYGHLAGNKILEEFSKLMRQRIVKDNYFCRYGGDEFVIVVNTPGETELLANRIIKTLKGHRFEYGENKIEVPLSIGIYEHMSSDKEDMASVIEKVDRAMYCAKRQGNNVIVNYRNMVQSV